MRRWRGFALLALLICFSNCSLFHNTHATVTELERVAKDWCLTIRASQVLCTYPLTEDLQVGDIYLVSSKIGDESRVYQAKGFLPFDTLLWRLQPSGYHQMYLDSYRTANQENLI